MKSKIRGFQERQKTVFYVLWFLSILPLFVYFSKFNCWNNTKTIKTKLIVVFSCNGINISALHHRFIKKMRLTLVTKYMVWLVFEFHMLYTVVFDTLKEIKSLKHHFLQVLHIIDANLRLTDIQMWG